MKSKKSIYLLILMCIFFTNLYFNQYKQKSVYTFNNIEPILKNNQNFYMDLSFDYILYFLKSKKNLSSSTEIKNNHISKNLININTANEEILKTLPMIGDVLAKNIVDYRIKNGNFKSIEEIKNVNKIGDKIFQKIKNLITV